MTALSRGWRKAVRTAVQLLVGGGLTAAVNALAEGLSPNMKAYLLAGLTVLTALAQNTAETAGVVPTLLPTPGIVPSVGGVATKTAGTVETTVDQAGAAVGEVTGTVTDTGGKLLGEVTGVDGAPPSGDAGAG